MTENADRVRENTSDETNRQIDNETAARVQKYEGQSKEDITRRIEELDREWDVERLLETNASVLALSGLVLGATHSKKWLIVPGIVLPFLLQHAIQGWCPPLPVLRRLGVRTRQEIDREKYSLKVLRGDFDNVSSSPESSAMKALQAVKA